MSLRIKPAQEAKIAALAASTGRDKAAILEEVIDSYFDDLDEVRRTIDRRYDDFKSGRGQSLTPQELRGRLDRLKRELFSRAECAVDAAQFEQ